jgi:uncharacterized protein (DUF1015 family)
MIVFKPFRAYRPNPNLAKEVASRPYDVLDSAEARLEAEGNPHSFLRVIKAEIDLPEDSDPYDQSVYEKGRSNFFKMVEDGVFRQDKDECFYVYRLTMDNRSQTGIVGCCHYQQYYDGLIKKHELTRTAKENDRVKHVEVLEANAEPVFFSYRGKRDIDSIVEQIQESSPVYDFLADDGIRHELWVCDSHITNDQLSKLFDKVPALYVADGHHRTAAAARVGQKRKENNPNHDGDERYNYFMTVAFPDHQLKIFDYNRVIRDLNGHSNDEFLELIGKDFAIRKVDFTEAKPTKMRELSLYLSGQWYLLQSHLQERLDDPVSDLDVTVLSERVLEPILDIKDLRKSDRIDFVGGIRGLEELQRRVDSGEMAAAFALYPVSMEQLLSIADQGEIMPPKTTWFEPKLRSGLFVHSID